MRIINGEKFQRAPVGYDKANAEKRAAVERSQGYKARVIKKYPGEYSVFISVRKRSKRAKK